jgi:hypothetical protein
LGIDDTATTADAVTDVLVLIVQQQGKCVTQQQPPLIRITIAAVIQLSDAAAATHPKRRQIEECAVMPLSASTRGTTFYYTE